PPPYPSPASGGGDAVAPPVATRTMSVRLLLRCVHDLGTQCHVRGLSNDWVPACAGTNGVYGRAPGTTADIDAAANSKRKRVHARLAAGRAAPRPRAPWRRLHWAAGGRPRAWRRSARR